MRKAWMGDNHKHTAVRYIPVTLVWALLRWEKTQTFGKKLVCKGAQPASRGCGGHSV